MAKPTMQVQPISDGWLTSTPQPPSLLNDFRSHVSARRTARSDASVTLASSGSFAHDRRSGEAANARQGVRASKSRRPNLIVPAMGIPLLALVLTVILSTIRQQSQIFAKCQLKSMICCPALLELTSRSLQQLEYLRAIRARSASFGTVRRLYC